MGSCILISSAFFLSSSLLLSSSSLLVLSSSSLFLSSSSLLLSSSFCLSSSSFFFSSSFCSTPVVVVDVTGASRRASISRPQDSRSNASATGFSAFFFFSAVSFDSTGAVLLSDSTPLQLVFTSNGSAFYQTKRKKISKISKKRKSIHKFH